MNLRRRNSSGAKIVKAGKSDFGQRLIRSTALRGQILGARFSRRVGRDEQIEGFKRQEFIEQRSMPPSRELRVIDAFE